MQPNSVNPWMQTFSGIAVDMLNPTREMIRVEDLAHHLALECRFAGASKFHYSVAQHSYLACEAARLEDQPLRVQLEILLHDAHEAYTKDIHAPLRWAAQKDRGVGIDNYQKIANNFDALIRSMWNLPLEKSDECHAYDMRMLFTERKYLLTAPPKEWYAEGIWKPLDVQIIQWTPTMAEKTWLLELKRLTKAARVML